MKGLALVLAILVLVVSSHAVYSERKNECLRNVQNRIFEGRITALVHGLRDKLKTGIPEQGLPPLDPLIMTNLNLQSNNGLAKLSLLMNGVIDGLMSWNLSNVHLSALSYKFSYELTFPPIQGSGNYDVNGNIIHFLPMYGNGDFDVRAENLVINGNGKIRVSIWNQEISLESFSCNVTLGTLSFLVTGLMNDEALSELVSQMISESVPELLDTFRDTIDKTISSFVMEMANSILGKYTRKDLLDFLSPTPEEQKLFAQCRNY